MKGPQTGQHAKANHKEGKYPVLKGGAEVAPLGQLAQGHHRKGRRAGLSRRHIQGQYANPNQDAAGHQEQHQFHRPIFFGAEETAQIQGNQAPQSDFVGLEVSAAAPHANQQVHRQHRQFVEKEQEKQILHYKDAEHPGTQGQQQRKETPRPLPDGLGNQHRPEHHNAVQQHQGGGDAIHGQGKVNVQRSVQPLVGPRELVAAGPEIVTDKEDDRQYQGNQGHKDGEMPGIPGALPGQEHSQDPAGQRHGDGQKQGGLVKTVHRFPVRRNAATRPGPGQSIPKP